MNNNFNRNYDFEIKDLDPKTVKKFVIIAIVVILAVIIGSQSFYKVKEQESAVLITFGNAETVSEPGLHFKIPLIQKRTNVDMSVRGMTIGYNAHTDESIENESLMITKDFNFINVDKTIAKGKHGEAFINDTAKTDAGNRSVPINALVKPIIKRILKDYQPTKDGYLFHTDRGTLIATSVVNYEFRRIMQTYDIKDASIKGNVTTHSLRHTYATRCIEGGMPPKVLQKLLGHTDIKVTLDTYSDVFESFQTENVEKVDNYMTDLGIAVS